MNDQPKSPVEPKPSSATSASSPAAAMMMGGIGGQTPAASTSTAQPAAPAATSSPAASIFPPLPEDENASVEQPEAEMAETHTTEEQPKKSRAGCFLLAISGTAIGAFLLATNMGSSVEERRADRAKNAEAQYSDELKALASRDSNTDIELVNAYINQNACFTVQTTSRLRGEGQSSNATCPRTDKSLNGNITPSSFQVRATDRPIPGKSSEYSMSYRISVVPLAYGQLDTYRADNRKAVEAAIVKYGRNALDAFTAAGQPCAIVYSERIARHTEITERYDTVAAEQGRSVSLGCLQNGRLVPQSSI